MRTSKSCPSEYPGGVTLAGRAVACDDPRGKGHDGTHGNSFAARWWTDDAGPRGWLPDWRTAPKSKEGPL